MSSKAISVRNLSKSYQIAHNAARHTTAAEALVHRLKRPLARPQKETFWALNDVSFDVEPGDVVGIIGRNGAGKSTLLKVLSRITEPTGGEVVLRGRVGSLLEVGTGFHPELTGRENIYLNGAILGMTRREIDRQFDAIVDFSGTERFLDTPVKRYSSGMYVRLAFAVAAHLEPEILIVDEVLAVGDAEFQKKCMGKMQDVANHGRTILFVSHNMSAVVNLCNRAIFLRQGAVADMGAVESVLKQYMDEAEAVASVVLAEHPNSTGEDVRAMRRVELLNPDGSPESTFKSGSVMIVRLDLEPSEVIQSPLLSLGMNNWRGERICAVATYLGESDISRIHGAASVYARFELPALVPGRYTFDIGLAHQGGRFAHAVYSAIAFDVVESGYLKSTTPYFDGMGQILVRSQWSSGPLMQQTAAAASV